MRTSLSLVAVLALGTAAPAIAQVVDFESVASGFYPSLTLPMGSLNVTFSRDEGATIRASTVTLAPYSAGVFGGTAIDTALTFPLTGIAAVFSAPVDSVSIDFSDYSGPRLSEGGEDDTGYLYAYGSRGELLAVSSTFLPKDAGIFSGEFARIYVAAPLITSVRLTSTHFGDFPSDSVYWDNLRVNGAALPGGLYSLSAAVATPTAVPESSTYAAGAVALALGLVYRRRR